MGKHKRKRGHKTRKRSGMTDKSQHITSMERMKNDSMKKRGNPQLINILEIIYNCQKCQPMKRHKQ